ncbi:hypothetical protein PEC301937_28950 [Pectobacterium carotovorum subsp. carotovorum]|nr:hypothetical protein PEC301937_28950 [Pectobacterium carotovorum subsp. carotovorum]
MQEWADRLDRWEAGESATKTAASQDVGALGMAVNSRVLAAEESPLLREVISR